jgi:hypothetical protein
MTDKKYYGIPSKEEATKKKREHENHKLLTTMTTGPHYAKLICMSCGGKFVKWLTKEQYDMYK